MQPGLFSLRLAKAACSAVLHVTVAAMKYIRIHKEGPITRPLLKDLVATHKASLKRQSLPLPSVIKPLPPPDLYQDAGGGYNLNYVYPQL